MKIKLCRYALTLAVMFSLSEVSIAQNHSIILSTHPESLMLKQYEKTFFSHIKKLFESSGSSVKKIVVNKKESTSDITERIVISKNSSTELEISYGETAIMDYVLINPDSFSHEAEYQILKQSLNYHEYVQLINNEFNVYLDAKPASGFKLFTLSQAWIIYESLRDLSALMKDEEGNLVSKMKLLKIRSSSSPKFDSSGKIIAAQYIRTTSSTDTNIKESEVRFYDLKDTEKEFESIFFHELGHAIWFNALTTQQKMAFLDISWTRSNDPVKYKLKAIENNQMLTPYATVINCNHHQLTVDEAKSSFCSIPTEDFPEHFAIFVKDAEKLLRKASLKFEFIQNELFGGLRFKDNGYANLTFNLRNGVIYDRAPGLLNIISVVKGPESEQPRYLLADNTFTFTQVDPFNINYIRSIQLIFRSKNNHQVDAYGSKKSEIELPINIYGNYLSKTVFTDPMIFDPTKPSENPFYPSELIYQNLHAVKSLQFDRKDRSLKTLVRLDLKRAFADEYSLDHMITVDSFGNMRSYDDAQIASLSAEGGITWKVPGLATTESNINFQKELDVKRNRLFLRELINISSYETIKKGDIVFDKVDPKKEFSDDIVVLKNEDTDNVFNVKINRPHHKLLHGIGLSFESDQCETYEELKIENRVPFQTHSNDGDSHILFTIYVDPALYKCSIFNLKSITYFFSSTAENTLLDQDTIVSRYNDRDIQLKIEPKPNLYNFKPLKINLDKIEFDFVPGPNKPYYSPKIRLNLENWEDKSNGFYIRIKIIDIKGTGKEYYIFQQITSEQLKQFSPGNPIDIDIQERNPLDDEKPAYDIFPEGEYIIEEIETHTHKSEGQNISHAYPPQYQKTIDLKTRKITKKMDAN